MTESVTTANEPDIRLLPKAKLDDLIGLLFQEGFEVIGPRIEHAAIVYGPIQSSADLPIGWTEQQAPGSYRLQKRDDSAYFGYAVGPHCPPLIVVSLKPNIDQVGKTAVFYNLLG